MVSPRVSDCVCDVVWEDSLGSYDTVTGAWLPEEKIRTVSLVFDDACPYHQNPISCWSCERTTCDPRLKPGWAVRCDGLEAACPRHTDEMPPFVKRQR